MNDTEFKIKYKFPACTKAPWVKFIPYEKRYETMRQIRMESIDIYGYPFDECPKRLMCISKQCIGRPLPWKSPTARPYLIAFARAHNVPVEDEYYVKGCDSCPIRKTCERPCYQVEDFINRRKTREPVFLECSNIDNYYIEPQQEESVDILGKGLKAPWDILNETKLRIVRGYLYEGKDFKYLADILNLTNQSRVKYEFYSALNKMSEYATMRKFLQENVGEFTDKQWNILKSVYLENNTLTETANNANISKQAVQQMIARIVKKYNLTWQNFVKKKGTRVIYDVPGIMR